jgi:ABC-2 type transport system permease protein
MSAELARPPIAIAPSALARAMGLGSVFGKTIRDSRRAMLLVGGLSGLLVLVVAKAIVSEFSTVEARHGIGTLVRSVPPIMQGLAGKPVNVETLGGYIQYKYGGFFPLVTGLWSILALSATLAAETRRGSLEFVAAGPISRRRLALEKLGGHVAMVAVAMALVFVATWVAGTAFAELPGDAIPLPAAIGYAAWLGLMALAAGSVAFALAPFVGRGAAMAIAGGVMFAGFILNGYQAAIPELAPFANLTWFGWTNDHIPLAGQFDWASFGFVALLAVALFAVGVETFARRDLGATSTIPLPRLPRTLLGLRGPFGRATSERLSAALTWGLGIGLFGLMMASAGRSFTDALADSPEFMQALASLFPGVDIASEGGFLELVFIEFGLILAGLAAASLVGGWASDETSGRLEMLLATPLSRVRWAVHSGLGVFAAIGLIVLITAIGILLGALSAGGESTTPVIGVTAVGLYAGAMAGVGMAVGGLFNARIAATTVTVLTILTWLLDFLAPALNLPDAVHQLALSSHIGQPMVGVWDPAGVVLCLALAFGGLALGAWGMHRRDIGR